MTPEQLRALMQQLHDQIQAIIATAVGANRQLTADEDKTIGELGAKFDQARATLDRMQQQTARTAALSQSFGRRTAAALAAAGGLAVGGARADGDPNAGFRDMADFARSVQVACRPGGGAHIDERLRAMVARPAGPDGIQSAPANYITEGSGADAGYQVPPGMRAGIWELVFEGTDLINMVTAEPTESNAVEMLSDETTPWGTSGVKAKWRTEASQMTPTGKPVENPRLCRLNELYAFVTATDELLEDAPRLANRLTVLAARAIRWEASEAIMNGNGVGRPLGWMNSGAILTISKEVGQAAATINAQNLIKMYARLLYMGGGRATWLANRDTLPALALLTLGQNGLFMLPQRGMSAKPDDGAILGLPLQYNEHCKTLGTAGDIQLVDLDGYYLASKASAVKFDVSIHLYFDYGLQAFRWTFRIGGMPFLSAPITPANGSNTRSHFVRIEDRA